MFDLSIVIAARNDNYGGDFLTRLELSLQSMRTLGAELIVVDWNPPLDRIPLSIALPPDIRVITVPPMLHDARPASDRMPIFEYAAKNVGIRRALGQYVLATNADIILSPEMVGRLADPLTYHEDCFYRANRHDVRGEIPSGAPYHDQLAYCVANVGHICYGADGQLHTDAAGDFLMMAKDRWMALRGYPEWPSRATLDSYMVALADRGGMRQVTLLEPIYHQDHSREMADGRPDIGWHQEHIGKRNEDDGWGLGGIELLERRIIT